MPQSTITDRFQTTIPAEVRRALNLKPRQRVSYEVRDDGTVLIRPVASLDDLFGSLRPGRAPGTPAEEKAAARNAIGREASGEGIE